MAVRDFLRRVGERMGQVVASPMIMVWDSARRDERRKQSKRH